MGHEQYRTLKGWFGAVRRWLAPHLGPISSCAGSRQTWQVAEEPVSEAPHHAGNRLRAQQRGHDPAQG